MALFKSSAFFNSHHQSQFEFEIKRLVTIRFSTSSNKHPHSNKRSLLSGVCLWALAVNTYDKSFVQTSLYSERNIEQLI